VSKWVLFLAEGSVEPSEEFTSRFPGVERVFGRFWYWEGELSPEEMKKLFPFGEDELAGKVYARAVARGNSLEDFHNHPIAPKVRESLLATYRTHTMSGHIAQAMEVAEKAKRLGMDEGFKEINQMAEEIHKARIVLSAAGVPFNILEDGKIGVGNPPAFAVETLEEAEKVAKVYAWARRNRVSVRPAPRGRDGAIRFFAELVPLQVDGEGQIGFIPLTEKPRYQKGFFALERRPEGAVARPVPLGPVKDVVMIFLPWS